MLGATVLDEVSSHSFPDLPRSADVHDTFQGRPKWPEMLQKLSVGLSCDSTILFWVAYPKEWKTGFKRKFVHHVQSSTITLA